jgi:quinol monooxygenase YgiN
VKLGNVRNCMVHNEVRYRVELTIEGSKIEEYKKLVQDMVRLVKVNEPDTINYEFYLNKSETSCIVNETYANSEAALAHAKGVASQTILPNIFNIFTETLVRNYKKHSRILVHRLTIYLLDSVVNSRKQRRIFSRQD